MAGGMNEALHIRIDRKLGGHVLIDCSSCSIFKVPNQLRQINDKAYEPQLVSIGPYHHGKDHLKAMESQKMHYLKLLLGRTEENSVERYVTALGEMEEEARKFYSEPLDDIGRDEFLEMMLLDGFFIIGLILQRTEENFSRGNAGDLLKPFSLRRVMCDLLLVENQLPFFILSRLFSLYASQTNFANARKLDHYATIFLSVMVPGYLSNSPRIENQDLKHLLGLLHDLSYSSEEVRNVGRTPHQLVTPCSASVVSFRRPPHESRLSRSASVVSFPRPRSSTKWQFIRSATELNEAGIKFQKKEGELFDIEFQKEVMSIPTLKIDDDTESILRNLVAHEQCYKGISSKRFTDYITFMDCLVNTGMDVELLCRCGSFDNWLGDHEVAATMFNRLGDSISISQEDFFYSEIFIRVNDHCNRKWNLWKANLWHNYFNTPWALISVFAAVLLLLCTMLQTLFSILSYRYH